MGWEEMWASGLGKGDKFDAAAAEPALQDLIDSGALPSSGHALVPGCGRGYAVAALAEGGEREVLGIDIAPTAVKAAQDFLREGGHKGKVEVGDFFTPSALEKEGQFSLGYDCTFLCAIPVAMRERWAQSWHRLLKPGGELVTLIFPIRPAEEGPDPADGDVGSGPPFRISLKLAKKLLGPLGFELISAEEVDKVKWARWSAEVIARWKRV